MSGFWFKIGALAIIVAGLIFTVKHLSRKQQAEPQETKSFYDIVEEDDRRLRADPEPAESGHAAPEPAEPPEGEITPAPVAAVPEPEPLEFTELSEAEKADAEKLFETAIAHRKIGRISRTGFKVMVDCCRQIISKYPDSIYAYKARRMLGDIPERFQRRYNITEEELTPRTGN
jgi:hypothetical protein